MRGVPAALVLATLVGAEALAPGGVDAAKPAPAGHGWAHRTLARLTLRDKAAQMIGVRAFGLYQHRRSDDFQKLLDQVRRLKVGCVVVFDDVSELVQAQRDAAWAEVARRLAHEIKNPLTPIQLSAERLAVKLAGKLASTDEEALVRGTQTIIAQVGAMKHMVDDFAIYARQARPGKMQRVDLKALLLDVLALYENLRPHVSLKLAEHDAVIQGEPTRLRQVFHNLIQNALDAQVDVAVPAYEFAIDARGDELTLSFADAGSGLPEDTMRHAFEPYVTTKAKGTGLGLAIVKKIVDEHHGRVTIENRRPRGARVTLHFPREGTKT